MSAGTVPVQVRVLAVVRTLTSLNRLLDVRNSVTAHGAGYQKFAQLPEPSTELSGLGAGALREDGPGILANLVLSHENQRVQVTEAAPRLGNHAVVAAILAWTGCWPPHVTAPRSVLRDARRCPLAVVGMRAE